MKELNKKAILKDLKENDIDIRIFSTIDSTNNECKRQCIDKKYLLITAEEQTKGRGRSGKKWISQKLGNVYMSFAFNNNLKNSPISLITGTIVHSILAKITKSIDFGLKWPNDILLKNKKIGGILVENEIQGNKIKTIIGIGINFNLEEKESWWSDLSEFSTIIERNNLINGITKNLIDNLNLVAEIHIKEKDIRQNRIEKIISQFEFEALTKLKAKHLSGGQKKKLVIAMALINDPNILLLDEPFAALDILTIKMLQEIIVNLQAMERITVVVCDHQARDLLTCVDRAIVLSNGKIIASGSPNEIINDANARSAYFGEEFKIN